MLPFYLAFFALSSISFFVSKVAFFPAVIPLFVSPFFMAVINLLLSLSTLPCTSLTPLPFPWSFCLFSFFFFHLTHQCFCQAVFLTQFSRHPLEFFALCFSIPLFSKLRSLIWTRFTVICLSHLIPSNCFHKWKQREKVQQARYIWSNSALMQH